MGEISKSAKSECPACGRSLKNVLLHIQKDKYCQGQVTAKEIHDIEQISNARRLESRKRKGNENIEETRLSNKKRKEAQRHREPDREKEYDRKRKAAERKRKLEKVIENERKKKAVQREREPEKVRENERK